MKDVLFPQGLRDESLRLREAVVSGGSAPAAESFILLDVLDGVLSRAGGEDWTLWPTDAWCYVTPSAGPLDRRHGWKLHVSATPLSAPVVLAAAATVLVRRRARFKFGTDLDRVSQLDGDWYDRGSSGKFITIYPDNDAEFRQLALELDAATNGLSGPRILSDRRLREGSLVHYRYGEFTGETVFTDDGLFEYVMTGPDGRLEKDARNAWFAPPEWASDPFSAARSPALVGAQSVLIGQRFAVQKAVRHANKGGVYYAVDEVTGDEVILKRARAHVGARMDGTDVRDRLRDEADMLDVLAPLAVAPAKLALFTEDGDLFLAQEKVPGENLQTWAARRAGMGELGDLDVAVGMARRLVALMRTVHDAGLTIRDFKPGNVMVLPSGDLRLVDVEAVAFRGRNCPRLATAAFAAPEVLQGPDRGVYPIPERSADCYSLGVTLFAMLTCLPVTWVSGQPGHSFSEQDRTLTLGEIARTRPWLTAFIELIIGLTIHDPARRWTLDDAERRLDSLHTPRRWSFVPDVALAPEASGWLDDAICAGLDHIGQDMAPSDQLLWNYQSRPAPDPCNAWHGAAGTLHVLTRAAQATGSGPWGDLVARTASWIDDRLFDIPRLLPGLAFGRAGTAWALYDASRLVKDETMAARALELARRLPVRSPSPDITHGLSGAGMAHVHLAQASGEADLRQRIGVYADNVLAAAQVSGDDWFWPTGTDTDSALAGTNAYGFAHGVAGVGAFLLAASIHGPEQGRQRWLDAAIGAGNTLSRAAQINDGIVRWPGSVGGRARTIDGHWCSGPAGIGGFLIRLWKATGTAQYAELANIATNTISFDVWSATTSACCGLAGDGQFLLDMAELTGDNRHRQSALHLAAVIHRQRRATSNGREYFTSSDKDHSYQSGSAGILAFLIRLRHGGPAFWMPTDHDR